MNFGFFIQLRIACTVCTVLGDGVSSEQEREKLADWQHQSMQPILPVSPFPV